MRTPSLLTGQQFAAFLEVVREPQPRASELAHFQVVKSCEWAKLAPGDRFTLRRVGDHWSVVLHPILPGGGLTEGCWIATSDLRAAIEAEAIVQVQERPS